MGQLIHGRFEPLIQFNAGIIAGIDGVRESGLEIFSKFPFPFFFWKWMDGWMSHEWWRLKV